MQSSYGNQAVNRLLDSHVVQAKMEVTPPSDSYEQEAEHVADHVMRASAPTKTESKDEKKKPEAGGGKKKEDDKVKRAAAKDEKKPEEKKKDDTKVKRSEDKKEDKKKTEDELIKRAAAKDEKKDTKKTETKDEKKKEDEKVKRAAETEVKEDDEEKVHRAATTESIPDVTPEIERSVHSQRSSGHPLPDSLRSYFEPRFGKDLSNVRLHTDSRAAETASKLKAQAFTHGQDIYFASGKYQPMSDSGKHLLAHEITHTVQQSGSMATPIPESQTPTTAAETGPMVSRAEGSPGTDLVQRNGAGSAGGTAPAAAPPQGTTGGVDAEHGMLVGDTITFDKIEVPGFKMSEHRKALYDAQPLKRRKAYKRGDPKQRDVWKEALGKNTKAIEDKLKAKHETATAAPKDKSGAAAGGAAATNSYVFVGPGNRFFLGDLPTVAKEMTLPNWTKTGAFHRYDVDHVVELQLADWTGSGTPNQIGNMELLDPPTNQASGNDIKNNIDKKVKKFNESTNSQFGKSEADIKSNYHLVFPKADGSGSPGSVGPEMFWKSEEITKGDQVNDAIKAKSSVSPDKPDTVYVFPSASGGVPKSFPASGGNAPWPKPFKTTDAKFDTAPESANSPQFGSLTLSIPEDHPHFKPFSEPVELTRIPGAQFAGVLDKNLVASKARKLEHKKASPIEISDLDIDAEKGLVLSGAIKPNLPILEGKQIDFELAGNDLTISMEFGAGDLNVPKPFVIKGSTIRIFASTGTGLGAEGQVDFGIERVGEGFLKASVGTSEGLNVAGEFNFDSKLFKPATVGLAYEDQQFKAHGVLGIPEGKVKGIKTATITANYEAGTFKAAGTAELTIPGIKKGDLNVEYSEAAGLNIAGGFTLADNIPGIKGGNAKVSVNQVDDGYKVKADITAQPAIPGFNTEIKGTYDDGAIDISGTASYARGIASGQLTLGATNRAVDDEGKPTGATGDKFSAYGSGEVTLRLTEWLQGTIGVKIKANAELVFKGKLGLPSSVNLFPKKEVKQTLLPINIPPIPIFPPIIAEIGGSLDANASFGPGQLKDLSLSVTYNPDHEDDTVVEGTGDFFVPAEAGLSLKVHAGVGASAAVASLTGGIEVSGGLGIQGKAEVKVDVVWTPTKGVDVKGEASASAEPKLIFKVDGYVKAELGVPPLTVELFKRNWNFAGFEYGSGLKFGITLPVHYNSKQPFDIKFEDIQIQKPDIDPGKILSDLLAKVG
jgi:hypothetical protein